MPMGTATAIASGLSGAGMLGSAIASGQAGRAAGAAADATAEEASRQSQRAEDFGKNLMSSVGDLSRATPNEMLAYERSLEQASNVVQRDAKMLDSIDPALMEASKQALNLMRGQDASALGPVRAQREQQRSNLVRMLREQLGPGAETSSIGQKQLQQFDMETSSLMNNVQQSTLGMFLNTAQNQRSQMGQNVGTLLNTGASFGNIANRGLAAGTATLNAMTGTGQQMVQSAGAPFVGEQVANQGLSSMFNQVSNMGASLLGNSLFGKNYVPAKAS